MISFPFLFYFSFFFLFCNRRCWWKIHQFYFPPQNPQPSATCMRRLQLTSHRNDPFVHVFFCLICAVSFAYGICNEWKIGRCTHTHTFYPYVSSDFTKRLGHYCRTGGVSLGLGFTRNTPTFNGQRNKKKLHPFL